MTHRQAAAPAVRFRFKAAAAALVIVASIAAADAQSTKAVAVVPTHAEIAYAPAEPAGSKGHLLDLYLPAASSKPAPVVIWTGGSAWMADNGKATAGPVAAGLNPAGFAVAGVSIRSSSQVKFPGQLHDIKAAIRWLRSHSGEYGLDPKRIAIMGDSSGGWTTAMAALTGDVPELEGKVGITGVSSAVQAAVAFYPPTDFLQMDAQALKRCEPGSPRDLTGRNCHDDASSPESSLMGCAIQSCAAKVQIANPARYVSANDPPLMILHGQSDALVPYKQGELLYEALSKACREAVLIALPKAGHAQMLGFLTDDAVRAGATMRFTAAEGCAVHSPEAYTPTWKTIVEFLQTHLR